MKLYTIPEVANMLGVTRQAIWERVKRGTIRKAKIRAGRICLIDKEELDRLKKESLR